jgi:alpha-tubulin suppressor-like RCC1 family protein
MTGIMQMLLAAIQAGEKFPLYVFGRNNVGQLGLNDTNPRSSPTQLGTSTDWAQSAHGNGSSFAIKTDGTLWAWGLASSGQLGLNSTINSSSPVQVGALTNWAQVSAAAINTGAVKTDGTLWSWGAASSGRLGNNDTTTNISSPIQIGALTDWVKVSLGGSFSTALKTNGTIWSWGGGSYGQLGINESLGFGNRSSPVQIGFLTNWAQVESGGTAAFARTTSNALYAWGRAGQGNTGQDDRISRSSPTQVGGLTNWALVSSSGYFVMAIKTDGSLWSWGFDGNAGYLGLNTTTINRSSPTQVGGLTNWAKLEHGPNAYHTAAIKTDGTLWCWGSNGAGELGTNDIVRRSSPVQIGSSTWTRANTGFLVTIAIEEG